jgi:hypothetical protein
MVTLISQLRETIKLYHKPFGHSLWSRLDFKSQLLVFVINGILISLHLHVSNQKSSYIHEQVNRFDRNVTCIHEFGLSKIKCKPGSAES